MARVVFVLLLTSLASCHAPPRSDETGAIASDELEARNQRITAELAALGEHAWAGAYFRGDGFDQNRTLLLAPGAGFTFRWSGCPGEVDRNWGNVRVEDGRLGLEFALPNAHTEHRGCPEVLVPVRWGERRYLIAPDEFADFSDSINGGYEPRSSMLGRVWLHEGDWRLEAEDRPDLPPEFRHYLLAQPLETTIVAVGVSTLEELGTVRLRHTRVTLGLGRAQGVFVGMTFHVGPQGLFASVLAVDEATSEACLDGYDDPAPVLPVVGWRASTLP